MLSVSNLKLKSGNKIVLKGVNLNVKQGEIVALMGPNGAGKTSLAQAIMGAPQYKNRVKGKIRIGRQNVTSLSPNERARKGIFLSFQTPIAIPGLRYSTFLRKAFQEIKNRKVEIEEFRLLLEEAVKKVDLPKDYIDREINLDLSGGEIKKMEILQMLILQPKYIILDEIDSGLDVDSLKLIANILGQMVKNGAGLLVITHYKRILEYLKPARVFVMRNGQIIAEGNSNLADDIEKLGYEPASSKRKI